MMATYKLLISANNLSEVLLEQFEQQEKRESIRVNDFLVSCLKQELHCTQEEALQHCLHGIVLQTKARRAVSGAIDHRFKELHKASLTRDQKNIFILENRDIFGKKVDALASSMLEKDAENRFAQLEDIDLLLVHQKPFSDFTDSEVERMYENTCFWKAVCDINLAIANENVFFDDDFVENSYDSLYQLRRMQFMTIAAFIVAARHKLSDRDRDHFVWSSAVDVALDTLPHNAGNHNIRSYLVILVSIAVSFYLGIMFVLNGLSKNLLAFCFFIALLLFFGFCIGTIYIEDVKTQELGYFYCTRFLLKLKLFFRRLFQKRSADKLQPHSAEE